MTFFQYPGGACEIKGTLYGLTEGKHGIHILEFGDISQGSIIYDSLSLTVIKLAIWIGLDLIEITPVTH